MFSLGIPNESHKRLKRELFVRANIIAFIPMQLTVFCMI